MNQTYPDIKTNNMEHNFANSQDTSLGNITSTSKSKLTSERFSVPTSGINSTETGTIK